MGTIFCFLDKQPVQRNIRYFRTCLISRMFRFSLNFSSFIILKHSYSHWFFISFWKDDLSYHKTATQSITYTGGETLYGAGNAVDRNTLTCMRTREIGTRSPDKTVWWTVDLGDVYSIYSINILFKDYDGFGKFFFW